MGRSRYHIGYQIAGNKYKGYNIIKPHQRADFFWDLNSGNFENSLFQNPPCVPGPILSYRSRSHCDLRGAYTSMMQLGTVGDMLEVQHSSCLISILSKQDSRSIGSGFPSQHQQGGPGFWQTERAGRNFILQKRKLGG